jgi:peroxiredoxin
MRTVSIFLFCSAFSFTAAAAQPARPSPVFAMQRVGAGPLPLSQYRGKVVALAFIYTTCSHCQQLTTVLNSIAREYSARGVQVLECAFNDDAAQTIPDFLKQLEPPFPVGFNTQAAVRSYLQYTLTDARTLYVPHLVFLDRRGIIRGDYPGESEFLKNAEVNIRSELDKLLRTPESAKK